MVWQTRNAPLSGSDVNDDSAAAARKTASLMTSLVTKYARIRWALNPRDLYLHRVQTVT